MQKPRYRQRIKTSLLALSIWLHALCSNIQLEPVWLFTMRWKDDDECNKREKEENTWACLWLNCAVCFKIYQQLGTAQTKIPFRNWEAKSWLVHLEKFGEEFSTKFEILWPFHYFPSLPHHSLRNASRVFFFTVYLMVFSIL